MKILFKPLYFLFYAFMENYIEKYGLFTAYFFNMDKVGNIAFYESFKIFEI